MTLEQRIDNILGPWPTPDQTREALLLLARQHDAGEERVTLDPAHKGRVARTPDGKPWTPAERYDEMVARFMAVQAEVAEHRRHVATVMQRENALRKRVEELEHERYVSRVKGWADEYDRVADVVREYNERED